MIVMSSCSQSSSVNPVLKNTNNSLNNIDLKPITTTLQKLYVEENKASGFKNEVNNEVDSFTTFRGVIVNDFLGNKVHVNKEKLKIFVLLKLKRMTQIENITRDLTEEKNTIELVNYLNIQLTEELKKKIIKTLDNHILRESQKSPQGKKELVYINRQFKTQIAASRQFSISTC
ncbi:hypothetical protein [Paenibacillus farraposensis]|nr:hypothetical protein [Paenibacillus farraposensis]